MSRRFQIPATMRAVVYRGPGRLQVEAVPVPRIGPGELLVRVACCGICPTDLKKIQTGTVPAPRIFGHETAGTVVAAGRGAGRFRPGDRVALHHHVPCGRCHACRHQSYAQCPQYKQTGVTAGFEPAGGGFAEYVRVLPFCLPGVVPIPRKNGFEEGALLEPVNTVMKGLERLQLQAGDTAVIAGQGPIGLLFTRLLALAGIHAAATDLFSNRLRMARRWGADLACRPEDRRLAAWIRRRTLGRGVDAAILAVPAHAPFQSAWRWVRGGGRILLFAHTRREDRAEIDLASVCVDEKDLLGSYSADWTLQARVARLVFSRKLDVRPLITHRFPLERAEEGIALASRPDETALKILIEP